MKTLIALLLLVTASFAQAPLETEDRYYTVENIPVPPGERLEVGGIDYFSDGRLAVSTRRGRVWIAEGTLDEDLSKVKWTMFAEGLHDCLGLKVVNDEIYVVQRAELTRLRDRDGDGRADAFDCVSDFWGVSGNYHEFAFGLPQDDEGNLYVGLNVAFFSATWWLGRSPEPYRGWLLRIAPDGTTTPVASGFRSPCGIARNTAGDIFVTDNQGDWLPACPIHHVEDGGFYGHPASLEWTPEFKATGKVPSDSEPPDVKRKNPAVWIPYKWSRSTGNLVADRTGGKFGPFADQLFVAELTNGYLLRSSLEKVRGQYQGAIMKFHSKVGSAVRVRFAPDGSLIVGRTNRGWGGQSPADGLARVRPTGETPLEIAHVKLEDSGFRVDLTEALNGAGLPDPESIEVTEYDYNYWWKYGSPEQRSRTLRCVGVDLENDRKTLRFAVPGLRPGKVVRLKIGSLVSQDGSSLIHDEFAYTINQMPSGPLFEGHVAKKVPAPRPMENSSEGRLTNANGRALDSFRPAKGWRLGDVEPKKDDPTAFEFREEPVGDRDPSELILDVTNAGQAPAEALETRWSMGDQAGTIWFRLPKGGKTRVYLMGRYGITLADRAPAPGGDPLETMGAITPGRDWNIDIPDLNGNRGHKHWHWMSFYLDAPRYDASGKKVADARLKRLTMNDVLLYENVRLPGPSADAPYQTEAPEGPLVLRGDLSEVAYRSIDLQVQNVEPDLEGWTRIFDGKSLDGWKISDGGDWKVEDGQIVGRGKTSHLFAPQDDLKNFEVRGFFKINARGNSGLYVRAAFGSGWPAGYEAQINSTYRDPVKTGSLYNHELVKSTLVPANMWFKYHVQVRDEAEGTRIKIRVNDVLTVDHLDRERKYPQGHVALQQHHEGSEIRARDLEIRPLK
jgi:glucose/arabinose dehydrogenase